MMAPGWLPAGCVRSLAELVPDPTAPPRHEQSPRTKKKWDDTMKKTKAKEKPGFLVASGKEG